MLRWLMVSLELGRILWHLVEMLLMIEAKLRHLVKLRLVIKLILKRIKSLIKLLRKMRHVVIRSGWGRLRH